MNAFTAHSKVAAMKMKLATWIKKVDCGDLGPFESLSSFNVMEIRTLAVK